MFMMNPMLYSSMMYSPMMYSAMFAPMMGTIPFVGYVFELALATFSGQVSDRAGKISADLVKLIDKAHEDDYESFEI